MAVKDLFAPHVLFLIVENPNLRKPWAWVGIAGSKFTILVVAPSVKIAVLVDHVAIIVTDAERMKLRSRRAWLAKLKHSEWLYVTMLPMMNPVQRSQGCKIITMSLDLPDLREAVELCSIVAFIDLENFSTLRHHEHLLVSTFDVNHSFILELRCQRELTHR